MFPTRIIALGLVVLFVACERPPSPVEPEGTADPEVAAAATEKIGPGVLEAVRRGESPRIVVALDVATPSAQDRPRELTALRRQVAEAQDEALFGMRSLDVRRRYRNVPALAVVARSEEEVERLAASPRVRRIDLDLAGTGALGTSVPMVRADLRHDRGNDGSGVVVAVLDTGIDTDNDDLADGLAAEACFGFRPAGDFCPDGTDRQTGPGSAEDDAGHGTHVSGIVASRGTISSPGVAPGASIVAIKVLDNCTFAGCFYAFTEIVAALDYIIDNPGLGVQVINLSLGTGTLFTGACDTATAGAIAGAAAVNTLQANGVITIAASGNDGSGTQMPLPACLSNVVSVGSVNTSDVVAGSSNSAANTDIFAPGVSITSLAIGGGTLPASGTSMASPHAAGCAALFIQAGDATTPAQILTRLQTTDVQVTDPKNNLTFPRIDCVPDANQPPDLTADDHTVTVDEGSVATNTGTVSDPDGDAFTLSASIGTVVDNGDGTWSWSFGTTDGPAETQEVTITATDVLDAEGEVTFDLVVNNVAPIVDAGDDATVESGEVFDFSGTFSDPGVIDFPWSFKIDWGFGDPTVGSTNDQSAPILDSRQVCTPGTFNVTLTVTDKDGDSGSDFMVLEVTAVEVSIMIQPEDAPNPVNLNRRGVLPVAILSTEDFDATSLDPASILLGDEVDPDTPVAQRPNGTFRASVEDVNGDGLPDLVVMFDVQTLVANGDLTETTTELVLRGVFGGCTNVRGVDSVTVVP